MEMAHPLDGYVTWTIFMGKYRQIHNKHAVLNIPVSCTVEMGSNSSDVSVTRTHFV